MSNYIPKSRFDEVNTGFKNYKTQYEESQRQLDALKSKAGDNKDLTAQIEKLKADNQATVANYQSQIKQMKVDTIISDKLAKAGARNQVSVKALLGDVLTNAKLNEAGEIVGLDSAIKALQEGTDTSFLFKTKEEPTPSGFKSPNVPTDENQGKATPQADKDGVLPYSFFLEKQKAEDMANNH